MHYIVNARKNQRFTKNIYCISSKKKLTALDYDYNKSNFQNIIYDKYGEYYMGSMGNTIEINSLKTQLI